MNNKCARIFLIGTAAILTACGSIQVERKELAAMDAKQVLLELAKQRPIQIAWRDRIVNSMLEFSTANFTVHQVHYVAGNLGNDGKDYWGANFIKSYCDAIGGIYPDKTFNSPNPKGARTDCVSAADGKLLFSSYTSTSSKFSLVMGGSINYNIFGLVVPKTPNDIDPAIEVKMDVRELAHNYMASGAYRMPSLEATGLVGQVKANSPNQEADDYRAAFNRAMSKPVPQDIGLGDPGYFRKEALRRFIHEYATKDPHKLVDKANNELMKMQAEDERQRKWHYDAVAAPGTTVCMMVQTESNRYADENRWRDAGIAQIIGQTEQSTPAKLKVMVNRIQAWKTFDMSQHGQLASLIVDGIKVAPGTHFWADRAAWRSCKNR